MFITESGAQVVVGSEARERSLISSVELGMPNERIMVKTGRGDDKLQTEWCLGERKFDGSQFTLTCFVGIT